MILLVILPRYGKPDSWNYRHESSGQHHEVSNSLVRETDDRTACFFLGSPSHWHFVFIHQWTAITHPIQASIGDLHTYPLISFIESPCESLQELQEWVMSPQRFTRPRKPRIPHPAIRLTAPSISGSNMLVKILSNDWSLTWGSHYPGMLTWAR